MKAFLPLPKPQVGDTAAIVSPSAALAEFFPWVHDLGLTRLRDEFGLIPKEYPTTRRHGSSYKERAYDLMSAFQDESVKAVLSTVGGEDEIGLIKYLDPEVFLAHPKPFFGYSDNTHIHNFLWRLGIPSYYGFSTLAHMAMEGGMHDLTVRSLRHAFFESGPMTLEVGTEFTDINLDWADKANMDLVRPMEPNDGWYWDGDTDACGILWGGCYEVLQELFVEGRYVPDDEDMDGIVFYMETSELIPDPFLVGYFLTGLGERGWLDRFSAILVGRPKAWSLSCQNDPAVRAEYRSAQRESILSAVRTYNHRIPVVQNLDFGHTDPQAIIPNGGWAEVVSSTRTITLTY